MRKTGLLLKDAREKQGISLNAVSAATKISVKVLEAIEAGDLTDLPPKTFVRGFVQTYAMFLKIDSKPVMDLFQEEVGTTRYAPTFDAKPGEPVSPAETPQPVKPATKPPPEPPSLDKPGSGIAKWLMAGLALFLFIAIYFVSQTVQKYKRESELPGAETEEATPAPSDLPAPSTETTPEPAASPASVADASPTPAASVEPAPSLAPTTAPSAAPTTPPATPTPAPVAKPEATSPQFVTIEALDAVKIEYQIDDGPTQSISLEPEQKKKFAAKRTFLATVSDGGAVSVIHNGKDKGVPGNLGQPMTISYPPKE
ncbi:MAG: helix-turn-helix domain-containing protein [Bdellovibrionia bacterium]